MTVRSVKNKIAIVCPYFGTLPSNYKYTLATMAANSFIDWYIITDDVFEDKQYVNVFCIKSDFDEIKRTIKNQFGFNISRIYKLCDYKPLYGIIFQDIVQGYEYWGYSDLDILYGSLEGCLSENNLRSYDKILELGHLSIYRNDPLINSMCWTIEKNGYSLRSILESDNIYVLDESYGNGHLSVNELLEQSGYSVLRKVNGCKDVISRYRNLHIVGDKREAYTYLKYENGKLYVRNWRNNTSQEIIYVHFQKRQFENTTYENTNEFAVVPKGFVNESKIQKNCFYVRLFNLRLWWYIKLRFNRWITNKQVRWK